MGKLKIECLQRKLKVKKLAKAVYIVLGQKAKLKAEVVFESGKEMTDLNKSARGVDSITDVLSFPSLDGIKGEVLERDKCNTELDGKYIFIGSIVLCDEKIRAQAQELGHSEEEERNYLIIHGLMHLMGYDHMTEEDKKEMREKEKAVVEILTQKNAKSAGKKEEPREEESESAEEKLSESENAVCGENGESGEDKKEVSE